MQKIELPIKLLQELANIEKSETLKIRIKTEIPVLFAKDSNLVAIDDILYFWTGTHWSKTDWAVLVHNVSELVRQLRDMGFESVQSKGMYEELEYLVKKEISIVRPVSNVGFMNFLNGTLEIKPGMTEAHLKPHCKTDYITDVIDFNFKVDAKDKRFDELFNFAVPEETDQTLLLQFFLSGFLARRPQGINFLVGAPKTSKGTMLELFKAVLGEAMIYKTIDTLTDKFTKADIVGKRLIAIADAAFPKASKNSSANDAFKLRVSMLRDFSDGIPMDFERKFMHPVQTDNYPAIVLAVNPYNIPAGTFESEFARRISYIRMDNRAIPGQYGYIEDLHNIQREESFKQAFIWRALCELHNWDGKAYIRTAKHTRDAKSLTEQADSATEFLNNHYAYDKEGKYKSYYPNAKLDLYDNKYTDYCNEHGYTPRSYTEFKECARSLWGCLPEKINGTMKYRIYPIEG